MKTTRTSATCRRPSEAHVLACNPVRSRRSPFDCSTPNPIRVNRTNSFTDGSWLTEATLWLAQTGGNYVDGSLSVALEGQGSWKGSKTYRSDTFRCVYAVKFAGAVYVLHGFQKKSKVGIKTPKQEILSTDQPRVFALLRG